MFTTSLRSQVLTTLLCVALYYNCIGCHVCEEGIDMLLANDNDDHMFDDGGISDQVFYDYDDNAGYPIVSVEIQDDEKGWKYRLAADRYHDGLYLVVREERSYGPKGSYGHKYGQSKIENVDIHRGEKYSQWKRSDPYVPRPTRVSVLPGTYSPRMEDYNEDLAIHEGYTKILWKAFGHSDYLYFTPKDLPKQLDPVANLIRVNEGDGFVDYKIVTSIPAPMDLYLQVRICLGAHFPDGVTIRCERETADRIFLSEGEQESEVIRVATEDTYLLVLEHGERLYMAEEVINGDRVFNKHPSINSFREPIAHFGRFYINNNKLTNFTTINAVAKKE